MSASVEALTLAHKKGIPQAPVKVGPHTFVTASWRKVGESYEQDTAAVTCSCFAFANPKSKTYQQPCKHLKAAILAEFLESLEKAEAVDTATLAKLLPKYRKNRPQRLAILVTVASRLLDESDQKDAAIARAEALEDGGDELAVEAEMERLMADEAARKQVFA